MLADRSPLLLFIISYSSPSYCALDQTVDDVYVEVTVNRSEIKSRDE